MHSKTNKIILDGMSIKEKLYATTAEEFGKRGKLIADYREMGFGYYITLSDYPYKNSREHRIIWLNDDLKEHQKLYIFETIKDHKYDGRTIQRNQPNNQSVKREHIHLIKF